MSAHCQVTGRAPGFGNTVSHSHRRSRRRWSPNIQNKTYYLPSEDRRIRLRVSTRGIKIIDRDRLVLRKYDPILRRHVDFREER